MYAILDGSSSNDPQFMINTAYFYQKGNPEYLFSYQIDSDSNDNKVGSFVLRDWGSEQSLIPVELYPTLQSVQYEFSNNTFTGNCSVPTSPTNASIVTESCTSGSFETGRYFPVNLTSNVPLNTTYAGTDPPSRKSLLRAVDAQWWYSDYAPSLILQQTTSSAESDAPLTTVLRTTVTKPSDCTELKACISGTGEYPGSVVGAEVMAPLGLILMAQANYASHCADGGDSGGSPSISFGVSVGFGG